MINKEKLLIVIHKKGFTKEAVSEELGININEFEKGLNEGFDSNVTYALVELLDISDPASIFFAQK